MIKNIYPTLYRDFSSLVLRRRFWLFIALWSSLCAILFFTYLEDFLSIQAVLRAKNFRYGVTDLVLVPYLKTTGYVCIIFMASLCAKLFHHELFSAFSQLYRTIPQSHLTLVGAKFLYVKLLSFLAVLVTFLPVIGCGLFFDYDTPRIILLLTGLFMLFFSVGVIAMMLSQVFTHSIIVVLVTIALVALPELAARIVVDPAWLQPVIAFFSPISHMDRIASGVIAVSDVVFFAALLGLITLFSVRQFSNTYFLTR